MAYPLTREFLLNHCRRLSVLAVDEFCKRDDPMYEIIVKGVASRIAEAMNAAAIANPWAPESVQAQVIQAIERAK